MQLERVVRQDSRERKEIPVPVVNQDRRDPKVIKDNKVLLGRQVLQDKLVQQAPKVPLDQLVQVGRLVIKVSKVQLVIQELLEMLDLVAHRAILELLVHLDLLVQSEIQDNQA